MSAGLAPAGVLASPLWSGALRCPCCGGSVPSPAASAGCPGCRHGAGEHESAALVELLPSCSVPACLCLSSREVVAADLAASARVELVAAAVPVVESVPPGVVWRLPVVRPVWVPVRLPLVCVGGRPLPVLAQPAVLGSMVLPLAALWHLAGWVL